MLAASMAEALEIVAAAAEGKELRVEAQMPVVAAAVGKVLLVEVRMSRAGLPTASRSEVAPSKSWATNFFWRVVQEALVEVALTEVPVQVV